MFQRQTQLRRCLTLAVATMLVVTATACADDDPNLPETAPSVPPPPTVAPTPELDPTHQEILEVYQAAMIVMVDAHQAGDPDYPDLAIYLLERSSVLLNLQSTIRRNEDNDVHYSGTLEIVSADVTAIDTGEGSDIATVESCVDYADYRLVHRDDGSPVRDEGPLGRYPVTTQLLLGTDDRWYVATQVAHWEESC